MTPIQGQQGNMVRGYNNRYSRYGNNGINPYNRYGTSAYGGTNSFDSMNTGMWDY